MIGKKFLLFILSFLLVIGLLTFFGDKGLLHLIKIKKDLYQIQEHNNRIEEENNRLMDEVRRLKNDRRYIEEIARKELGMVKEDEIVYQFDLSEMKGRR